MKPDPHAWLDRHVESQKQNAAIIAAACEAESVCTLDELEWHSRELAERPGQVPHKYGDG